MALIVVSPVTPAIHPKFIDRYLILLNKLNIKASLILNKADLIDKRTEDILAVYEKCGIKIYKTEAQKNIGIAELKKDLLNKQVILIGQSGVGKTTLTNCLCNTSEATKKVGEKTKRGVHTTTNTKNHLLNSKTMIIDSPGIRAISLKNLDYQDVLSYFQEFEEYRKDCKFKDCLHNKEDIEYCAVKQAVFDGKILKSRYESYIKLITE